jgi:D-alanine-D-alanine ligase
MSEAKKIRVAVLYGGRSAEHEVSLKSAMNVIENLDLARFDVIPIGIDRQGNWLLGEQVFKQSLVHQEVNKIHHDTQTWFTTEWIGKSVPSISSISSPAARQFDVIFPVVHGTFCEDGTLQGLLELADLPYVGCGVLASAVGMDKDVAKRLAALAGIPVAPYLSIKNDQWLHHSQYWITQIEEKLHYPVFVKPANTGSSIGITKVKNKAQLDSAIHEAFRYDTKILVEKGLSVREIELAVLESPHSSQDPIVSTAGEIRPTTHEFYSYTAKYLDENGAELLIPAPVSDEIKNQAQLMAKKLFITLECEGMSRVDLFLEKETNQLYFNEINTIPGFTMISMYPKLMAASGISYQELLTKLIELAILKHKNKSQLVRSFDN